jgi:protein-S-isoprenylcysteine O-methyltransferase
MLLCCNNLYSICRHPSYAGWFWWSIGTQVLLGNPLCMCAYAYATWTFFNERIQYEVIPYTLYVIFAIIIQQ